MLPARYDDDDDDIYIYGSKNGKESDNIVLLSEEFIVKESQRFGFSKPLSGLKKNNIKCC